MLLQNYLYNGEKDLGGCAGIINQRKIRYMAGKDSGQKYNILRLDFWYKGDIEEAYTKVKISKKFLKWFIDDLLPISFNSKNKKRLFELRKELINRNYKGISESKNWAGEHNTKKGFWLWNGYSEEESIAKVKEVQSKNSLKKVQKAKTNPELYKNTYNTQVGYWIRKGFSKEESIKIIKERQRTCTIENMGIEKYNIRKKRFKESINSKETLQNRRNIMENKGIWIPLDKKSDWELYKNKVWYITNLQELNSLENIDKRGIAGIEGNYHLDHCISIKYGFDNGIPEKIIGNIDNLQMLSWEENYSKGTDCYSKIKD